MYPSCVVMTAWEQTSTTSVTAKQCVKVFYSLIESKYDQCLMYARILILTLLQFMFLFLFPSIFNTRIFTSYVIKI